REFMKPILDMCCGGKMFYYDKENPDVEFVDKRVYFEQLADHAIDVNPTTVADFRNLPFEDNSYHLVVFDPPHVSYAGEDSWMFKKYGSLDKDTWKEDLAKGFDEAMRVLKPYGTLVFKWNDVQYPPADILRNIPYKPIFLQKVTKTAKGTRTHWMVFMKLPDEE
ncbi:class I SAM-dependent methyltransferase, partial [Enterococcus avium]